MAKLTTARCSSQAIGSVICPRSFLIRIITTPNGRPCNIPVSTTSPTVCKRSSGWINCDNYVHITQPYAKTTNCDVSFANGELHHRETLQDITKSSSPSTFPRINGKLARQVSVCTRFCATTVAVHTLEKQAGVMERRKRSTEMKWSNRTLTWADRKDLAAETNKSAITDHVAKENYVTDWSGAKILDTESHRKTGQDNSRNQSAFVRRSTV